MNGLVPDLVAGILIAALAIVAARAVSRWAAGRAAAQDATPAPIPVSSS
jgi:hypothetical protein